MLIAFVYITWSNYQFVVAKQPNPVGIGILQWFLMIAHFTISIFIVGITAKKNQKKEPMTNWIIHGLVIALIIILYIVCTPLIWNYLWVLRCRYG
jgi:hypothetical protein